VPRRPVQGHLQGVLHTAVHALHCPCSDSGAVGQKLAGGLAHACSVDDELAVCERHGRTSWKLALGNQLGAHTAFTLVASLSAGRTCGRCQRD
jgi:hypothetical protein